MQRHSSLPFTNTLSRVESTSAHLVAAAANTNCFNVDILKRNTYLWGLTVRGQCLTTSDWVYFSHSVISCAPGILSCEKQTLCRGFFLLFFFRVFGWFFFFFFRKAAGSGTALSHHFKFLILLVAFDFVLGLIGSTEKRSNLDTPSTPSQPPPQWCFSLVNMNRWGLRSNRSWYTNFQA